MILHRGLIVLLLTLSAHTAEAGVLEEAPFCYNLVEVEATNEIVEEVFHQKFERLAENGILDTPFVEQTRLLNFVVCDNPSSYDTFVVPDEGVVFDLKMLGFLFAQSRALMLGRYLGVEKQFSRHERLVTTFVERGGAIQGGPVKLVIDQAIADGVTPTTMRSILQDEKFNEREQTLFLQSLYFLSMHERCHVFLGHGAVLKTLSEFTAAEQSTKRHEMELAADQCAQDIVNRDEARYRHSPISFFGVMLIVSTQYLVESQPGFSTLNSHPSSPERIQAARDLAIKSVQGSGEDQKVKYELTLDGTADYFRGLTIPN